MRVLVITSHSQTAAESPESMLQHGVELCPYSDALGALLGMADDRPQLIIVPTDLEGVDILRFIDAVTSWTDIPIVVGIASDGNAIEIAARAVERGATAFIGLPLTTAKLVKVIRDLGFREFRDRSAKLVQVGDLVLDPQAFRATVGDALMPLSLREFTVLHHLVEASPRVVPAEELAENGYDDEVSPDAVRTVIKRVRQKLDLIGPGTATYIKTVHGQGYQAVNPN